MTDKENKTEFNAFMEKAYEKYTEDLLEECRVSDIFKEKHLVYIDWLDQLSWEELCDYADLFADKKANEVNDNYVGQFGNPAINILNNK